MLVEAAGTTSHSPGPLHAFAARVAARRGRQMAAVAVARKLCVICWCILTRGEDNAFARPGMVRRKLRCLELAAGAPRRKSGPQADPVWNTDADGRERRFAEQAERAYERLVADWKAAQARAGAGATPGRASQGPSTRPSRAAGRMPLRACTSLSSVTGTRGEDATGGKGGPEFDFHP
jgi:hypothetical protein